MRHWYDDAFFYNLYPLGAVNNRRENDYTQSTQGLERLCDWVRHMQSLGCTAVYLGPVFESMSHGYDTTDYRKLDSRLGTNRQFAEFVRQCHDAGIKVVVDGVLNHTGRDFFAFRDLQKQGAASPYKEWYRGVHFGGGSPLGDSFTYEAWRGHFELPRLNPFCRDVCDYLFDTVRGWIDEFDIDGIRLDCADCLDFGFMRNLRRVCTEKKADFWLMGEVIHGDYNRWANADTLHSVTNYECSKGLYSSHNDGNMHEIAHSLNRQFGSGGLYRGKMLYNFVDNHDVNRIADTVKKPAYLPTVYTLLFTMPGLPSVYYGSEWGIHGVTDRVTDWNLRPQVDIRSVQFDDPALMEHITALAKIRAGSLALRAGGYEQLAVTSHQFAFRRRAEGEQAVVAINCADAPAQLSLPLDEAGWKDAVAGEIHRLQGGKLNLTIPAHGSVILLPDAAAAGADSGCSRPESHVDKAPPQPAPAAAPAAAAPVEPPPQPVRQAPAPQQAQAPQPPPAPVSTGPARPEGGVSVARVDGLPLRWDRSHPVFEHGECALVAGERCGVYFYEVEPGKSVCPYHYHTAREEVFYILSGRGLLRTPDGEKRVEAGDLLYFPANARGAHRLINNHHEPLRYLDFGAAHGGADACYYPDSKKVQVDGKVFRLQDETGYFNGE